MSTSRRIKLVFGYVERLSYNVIPRFRLRVMGLLSQAQMDRFRLTNWECGVTLCNIGVRNDFCAYHAEVGNVRQRKGDKRGEGHQKHTTALGISLHSRSCSSFSVSVSCRNWVFDDVILVRCARAHRCRYQRCITLVSCRIGANERQVVLSALPNDVFGNANELPE